MADNVEDVLELDEDQVIEPATDEPDIEDEAEGDEPDVEEVSEKPVIGFDDDEAAPASEDESSVIRDLRARNREMAAKLRAQEAGSKPEAIEVGEKPTLESCEYDEERFENELTAWHGRKADAAKQKTQQQEAAEKRKAEWDKLEQTYTASKAALGVDDFEDAEAEAAAILPPEVMALIRMTEGQSAGLLYAIARSPAKLEELSKLDPARAAIRIGELKGQLKMTTRKAPAPDRPVKGNAAPADADKHLARLEKEAERTGDRTKLIQYRRKLRA